MTENRKHHNHDLAAHETNVPYRYGGEVVILFKEKMYGSHKSIYAETVKWALF